MKIKMKYIVVLIVVILLVIGLILSYMKQNKNEMFSSCKSKTGKFYGLLKKMNLGAGCSTPPPPSIYFRTRKRPTVMSVKKDDGNYINVTISNLLDKDGNDWDKPSERNPSGIVRTPYPKLDSKYNKIQIYQMDCNNKDKKLMYTYTIDNSKNDKIGFDEDMRTLYFLSKNKNDFKYDGSDFRDLQCNGIKYVYYVQIYVK